MSQQLQISIYSFSYKQGIPEDKSGNGGGFVFDCRGILNPGRIQAHKTQTGRDAAVQNYLETNTQIKAFLESVYALISINIENYLSRGFSHLQISFGCTGGQHRSVYSADATAQYIQKHYPQVSIELKHLEQERKNWINLPY